MIVKIATQTWVKELLKAIRQKGGLAAGLNPPEMTIGSVTDGETPSASVINKENGYTLNLVLPKGAKGADAQPPSITLGTVKTGGVSAATLEGDAAKGYTLNLTLQRGEQGERGRTGETGLDGKDGKTPTFTVGTVETGPSPNVTISGSAETGYVLNFTLPTVQNI